MLPEQDTLLDQLYHEHFKYLVGYAFHYIHDWGKAEEVVQEAFCIASAKVTKVMESDDPLRWLKTTVKNVARNMKKHEAYQRSLILYLEELESSPSAPDMLSGMDIWEFCEQIVGKENFQLFKRIVLDGVSYLEAAKELGIGIWACHKRVQRTSKALRDGLKKYFE